MEEDELRKQAGSRQPSVSENSRGGYTDDLSAEELELASTLQQFED